MNKNRDSYNECFDSARNEFLSRTTDASRVYVESVPLHIIKAFSEASAMRAKNSSEPEEPSDA